MSTPAQGLDDVVKTLDYTFIDIPDLIDVDSLNSDPEPVAIEEKPAYAFNVTAGLQARHGQQQWPAQQDRAFTWTYWQQLQEGGSAQPSRGVTGLAPPPGGLGASLLEAATTSRLSQQQQSGIATQDTHQSWRQPAQYEKQQQQQQNLWQQQGTSGTTSASSRTTTPTAPTALDDHDMDEG